MTKIIVVQKCLFMIVLQGKPLHELHYIFIQFISVLCTHLKPEMFLCRAIIIHNITLSR